MPANYHITGSVEAEILNRMNDEEKLKPRRQGLFRLLFHRKINRFEPKSKGWLTLTL